MLQSQPKEPAAVDPPAEESKEPAADNDSEPYPEDDELPEEEEEDVDEEDDYPEEDLDKVREVSGILLCSVSEPPRLWSMNAPYFAQAPSSIKTPEKTEGEDTMPPYDAETQALIDCQ